MRMRKITLKEETRLGCDRSVTVTKLVDFIEFSIGQVLTVKEVDELCLSKTWAVTIL